MSRPTADDNAEERIARIEAGLAELLRVQRQAEELAADARVRAARLAEEVRVLKIKQIDPT